MPSVSSVIRETLRIIGKIFTTVFLVALFTGIVVSVSVLLYVVDISKEPSNINLAELKLNETSHVYIKNSEGVWEEYRDLYDVRRKM